MMPSSIGKDLTLAKDVLLKNDLSLVVVKNERILFKGKSQGIGDMLEMINALGELTAGSSLADSIVGRAAALLCVYSEIVGVYASTLSEPAASFLKANGIPYEFGTLVPKILNRRKDDICPFDKAVLGIEDPAVALERLKSLRLWNSTQGERETR
ncbi:DUF1893 domain-containing protein [Candidatus Bathyarchaeota archaeon]|nr:DUF1893 domain-containing protein [Candidatus Bathyarchaeota archaeon]